MVGTIASFHDTVAVIITMGATLAITVAIIAFSAQVRHKSCWNTQNRNNSCVIKISELSLIFLCCFIDSIRFYNLLWTTAGPVGGLDHVWVLLHLLLLLHG